MITPLRYRKDIDGLRAVAVLMVLFFHAGISRITGGFIGVDVFFVLTGFLITSILYNDMEDGSFSVAKFYLRRIKRLLPALLVVVSATVLVAFILLIPDDLIAFLDSCRYTLCSLSNFYFFENTGGYFHQDVKELPLMHTWSLAVEEQFYLLWPGLLFIAHRLLSKTNIFRLILFLLIGGGIFSQWTSLQHPGFAYFMLPSRFFEILTGACVAVRRERFILLSKNVNNILSVAGLLCIVLPAFLLNRNSVFPGLNAVWPCFGTALLLVSGENRERQGIVNRVSGIAPLVYIGLLSYSIYLWHWPIIAFCNYRGVPLAGSTLLFVLAAPIVLAGLSYVFIERPVRYQCDNLRLWPAVSIFWLLPISAGLLVYTAAVNQNGFPQRFAGNITELNRAEATQTKGACVQNLSMKSMPYCVAGVNDPRIDGLIIGDSYAGMHIGFIDVLAKDAGLSLRHRWSGLLPPIPGISVGLKRDDAHVDYTTARFEELGTHTIAILSSSWGGYGSDESKYRIWDSQGKDISRQADSLQMKAIEHLLQKGVKVVLIDRPLTPPGRKQMKRLRAEKANGKSMDDFGLVKISRGEDYFLNRVQKLHPDVLIIHPSDAICGGEKCDVAIKNTILYRSDGSHLNSEGAVLLGEKYLSMFSNPLKGI